MLLIHTYRLRAEKETRERRRISVRKMAEETDIHFTTISRLTSPGGATVKQIDARIVEALCRYFSCKLEELLELRPDEEEATAKEGNA